MMRSTNPSQNRELHGKERIKSKETIATLSYNYSF